MRRPVVRVSFVSRHKLQIRVELAVKVKACVCVHQSLPKVRKVTRACRIS